MFSYITLHYIILLSSGVVVMGVSIPTSVTQMKKYFNFDHVTIIVGGHIKPTPDIRELYKSLKIQIVNKDQPTFSAQNNCGFFIFGENEEDTKERDKKLEFSIFSMIYETNFGFLNSCHGFSRDL